jgi:hypothetical protein
MWRATAEADEVILLLCAGEGTRWGDFLGVPKQLVAFGEEPLLRRTVRLLAELGYAANTVCVTTDHRLMLEGVATFEPTGYRWTVETLLSTQSLWGRRVIVLLGDVFFTRRSLLRIMSCHCPIACFGRPWPSAYAGCNHGEIFALGFSSYCADGVRRGIARAMAAAANGEWGNLWDLYDVMTGFPIGSNRTESRLFHVIDDLTNDFDTPAAYLRVARRYRWASSHNRLAHIALRAWMLALGPVHFATRVLNIGAAPRKSAAAWRASRAHRACPGDPHD